LHTTDFWRSYRSIMVFALNPVDQGFFVMAEINKLSVGKTLDKLRGTNVPEPKSARLDEEIKALDREIERSRAARRRIERDQRADSRKPQLEVVRSGADRGKVIAVVLIIAIFFALGLAGVIIGALSGLK
jgi:hypothetical protein